MLTAYRRSLYLALIVVAAALVSTGHLSNQFPIADRTLSGWGGGLIALFLAFLLSVELFQAKSNIRKMFTYPRTKPYLWQGFVALFILYQAIALGWSPSPTRGLPGLVITAIFCLVLLLFPASNNFSRSLAISLMWASGAGALLFHLDLLVGLGLFAGRHESMYLVAGLAGVLSADARFEIRAAIALTVLSALFASQSRTAIVTALVLLLLFALWFTSISSIKRFLLLSSGLVIGALYWASSPGFRGRFLDEGDNANYHVENAVPLLAPALEQIGSINTNGRLNVWSALLTELQDWEWVFGRGAGSSAVFVKHKFEWNHPHNEYLRILFDSGALGLGLFMGAIATLLLFAWRRKLEMPPEVSFAILAPIIALGMLSLTDLALSSLGFVLPATLLIANALSYELSSSANVN